MKKHFFIISISLFLCCQLTIVSAKQKNNLIQFVDPFIGTGSHGHTFPGAAYPFGMVQLSPDNQLEGWDWCSGYHYSDNSIIGFSHTHLSGCGRSDLMDVMIMPGVGETKLNPGDKDKPNDGYRSRFSHAEESASPGYYKVRLKDYDILAELTATARCGFHRYTFPESKNSHILLDLSHHYSTDSVLFTSLKIVGNNTVTGARKTKGWGEPGEKYWSNQQIFFVIQFSKPFESSAIAVNDKFIEQKSAAGKNVKVVFNYQTTNGDEILIRVGISAVSVENAQQNLSKEIPSWNFNAVLNQTQAVWENELSKIKVEAPEKVKKIFYTALYHSFLAPFLYNDVNGEYLGFDKKIHTAKNFNNYTVMSLWDTFRAENPLLTLLAPGKVNDIVESMLAQYDQYGLLPIWPLWSSETNCMIGYHSVPVIVDAYFKGIRNFDVEKAYQAMKTSAMQDDFGVKQLKQFGYIPFDTYNKSVATALEYCYDDWCIAKMAKALGKTDDYNYFKKRSESYKIYFDKEYNLMNGVSSTGKFRRPFDPVFASHGITDWVEGNSWQYSFFVPHDVQGLINLHGGEQQFAKALNTLFSMPSQLSGKDVPIDVSGLIGQYAHGNEPSHHVAYLYDYINQPEKTQEKLHEIMTTLYTDQPDGLCGNEDGGQMSAWYVFSAMGFYPVNPAEGIYVIGTPMVEKAELNLNGKIFKIITHDLNDKNIYIQSIKLNGKNYQKLFITHQEIVKGGVLEFNMGSTPGNIPNVVLPPSVSSPTYK